MLAADWLALAQPYPAIPTPKPAAVDPAPAVRLLRSGPAARQSGRGHRHAIRTEPPNEPHRAAPRHILPPILAGRIASSRDYWRGICKAPIIVNCGNTPRNATAWPSHYEVPHAGLAARSLPGTCRAPHSISGIYRSPLRSPAGPTAAPVNPQPFQLPGHGRHSSLLARQYRRDVPGQAANAAAS